MSAPGESTWQEEHMMLSARDEVPFFPIQFDHDSFAKPQDALSHAASATTSHSYDSLPSSISTSLFEVGSNDSSVFGGSLVNDGQTSSSISSSRTGTRQDSFSDIHSRKASLSSTLDGSSLNQPAQSPELADSSFLANFPPTWASQVKQPYNNTYQHNRHSADASAGGVLPVSSFYTPHPPLSSRHSGDFNTSGVMPASSFYTSQHHETPAECSQGTLSMPYTTPMHLVMRSDAYAHRDKPVGVLPTSSAGLPLAAAAQMSHQPRVPVPDSALPGRSNSGKSRSSTSGSTRRAKYRRSRTGCMVCRKRKVKCDQDGQPCRQCRIGKRDCHYEDSPPKRKRKGKGEGDAEDHRTASIESTETASNDNMTSESLSEILSPSSAIALSTLQAEMEKGRSEGGVEESTAPFKVDTVQGYEETEEELQRKADALFAQHTNLHDEGGDDDGGGVHEQDKNATSEVKITTSDLHRMNSELPEKRRLSAPATVVTTDSSTTGTMDDSSLEATFADLTHHHALPGHGTWKPEDGIGSPFTKYVGLSEDECMDSTAAQGVSPAKEALPSW